MVSIVMSSRRIMRNNGTFLCVCWGQTGLTSQLYRQTFLLTVQLHFCCLSLFTRNTVVLSNARHHNAASFLRRADANFGYQHPRGQFSSHVPVRVRFVILVRSCYLSIIRLIDHKHPSVFSRKKSLNTNPKSIE